MVRNISGNYSACTDKRILAYGDTANDRRIGAYGSPALDFGFTHFIHFGYFRSGIVYIGKHHGWSAKNMIFEGDAFVYGHIVLDFASVSDNDVRTDYDILADITVFADTRP